MVVEAVKLRKTRFRKSRQAAVAEDVIERQIVPRLDTHSLSRSHTLTTAFLRLPPHSYANFGFMCPRQLADASE